MKRLNVIIPMVALVLVVSAVSCGRKVAPTPNKFVPLSEHQVNTVVEQAEAGHHQTAINDYTKAIQLDLDDAEAYYNRGVSYHNLGLYSLADADETKACSLDSKYC